MPAPGLNIEIRTSADLRAAKAVEAELRKQILAAKAAGKEYGHLEKQLNAISNGIRSKGFLGGATSEIMGLAERIPVVGALMRSLNGGVGLASAAFVAFAGALGVARKALAAFSQMEDLQTNFVTLLGTVDKAKARMADLSKFAAATPFNLPEIARASRILEGLTDGMLATGEGLRMVGDVAAATGTNFDEIAVTIGRMYAAFRDGAPIGEVAARLTELTGQNFRSAKSWDEARAMLERYNGSMANLSETISGKQSTLGDSLNMLMVQLGRPIAPAYKEALETLISALTKATDGLEKFLDAAERHGNILGPIVKSLTAMAAIWTGKFLFGKVAGGIAAITGMLARNKLAIDAETAALTRNTAAQAAAATARSAAAAATARQASIPGGAPRSRGAPFSIDVYRAERARGLTATDALARSRRIMAETSAEAAKAAPIWTRLKGGIASASNALSGLAGQLFSLKGMMATVFLQQSASFLGKQAGNYAASKKLGVRTSAEDMAKAEAIRADAAKQQQALLEKAKNIQTAEDRTALLDEIRTLTAAIAPQIRDAGFLEDPRGAQNQALADHAKALAGLARAIGMRAPLPTAADLQREQLASAEADRQNQLARLLHEEQQRQRFNALSPEEQLAEIKGLITSTKRAAEQKFTSPGFAKLTPEEQEKARTAANEKILELTRQQAALEASISAEKQRQAESAAQAAEQAELSTHALVNQLKIDKMRASGQTDAADRMENELRIQEDLAAMREQGITDEELLAEHARVRREALEAEIAARKTALQLETELNEARAAGNEQEIARLEWMREYNALLASGANHSEAARAANAFLAASAAESKSSAPDPIRDTAPGEFFPGTNRRRGFGTSDAFERPVTIKGSLLDDYLARRNDPVGQSNGQSILPSDPTPSIPPGGPGGPGGPQTADFGAKDLKASASEIEKLNGKIKDSVDELASAISKLNGDALSSINSQLKNLTAKVNALASKI